MGTNKLLILCGIFIAALTIGVLLTGGVRTDVRLKRFEPSQTTKTLTIRVDTASAIRNVRKAKISKDGNDLYIKFYSAYGFNSRLGTQDTYNLDINNIDEIYFYIGKKGYKKVLELRNNEWLEPYNEITVNKQI